MNLEKVMDSELKLSRFSHLFQRNEAYQLFNSIFLTSISLNERSKRVIDIFRNTSRPYKVIESFQDSMPLLQTLLDEHFLVNSRANESDVVKELTKKRSDEIDINMMYILLTDKCNLGCEYCFIEQTMPQSHKFLDMSEATALKAVDLFVKLSRESKSEEGKRINFYGGEPLLNKKVIRSVVEYIRERYSGEKINLNMVTNGCLVDEETARLLAGHRFSIGVSMDGRKEAHDSARHMLRNGGSFEEAVKGYSLLRRNGAQVGISLTIGKHNVEDLHGHVEYLVDTLQPAAFGFNFLVDFPDRGNPFGVPIDYATKKALESFDYLREKGIFEERIMRKLHPFAKKSIHLKDCGAIGNQIIVSPNGKVGPCHAFISSNKYFTKSVDSSPEEILNDPVFVEWSRRYPLNMNRCLNCEVLGICGGGCPYNAEVSSGSIWGLDERMCSHNKIVLDWILKQVHDDTIGKVSTG